MSNVLNNFKQAGSGSDNEFIVGGTMQTTGGQDLKKIYFATDIIDISTASSVDIASPVNGTITKIQTCINGAITVADAIITSSIDGVAITDGAITIAFTGSAAGTVDVANPTAANSVLLGNNIRFVTDGGSTDVIKATIMIEITLS
jgi:hypothetical protein